MEMTPADALLHSIVTEANTEEELASFLDGAAAPVQQEPPRPRAQLPGAYVGATAQTVFAPMPLAGKNDRLKNISYSHDGMIDMMLANPAISKGELAMHFGRSQSWVSTVIHSDAFQARLAERKAVLIDPLIAGSLEARMKALAEQSLQVLQDKLDAKPDADLALEAFKASSKALGYGARRENLQVQANFVVAMPGKAESAAAWVTEVKGG